MESTLVPIFVCFLLPVAIVLIVYLSRYRTQQSKNELIAKALEKGVPLDPNFFKIAQEAKIKRENPMKLFTWGVSLVGLGLGVFFLLYFILNVQPEVGAYALGFACSGLVPALVGVGLLVSFYAGRYYKKQEEEQKKSDSSK
ncbi:MAG TPA: DUF6249 domain-containing protein [Candidatus Egerieousia sp.]|nr:DUF6249 domain-containing protein [Candidatus Egerieousia sp.]HPT05056.1 DUF6249 domain-containing protein [Candidatus Egerieousia sp.]